MMCEKGLHFIKDFLMYLQTDSYSFALTIKPVVYNFTLQTFLDKVNDKINNALVLYRDLILTYKAKNIEILQLLPEEEFYVFDIIHNKKHIFKITSEFLLRWLNNNDGKYFRIMFEQFYVTNKDSLLNVLTKILASTSNDKNSEDLQAILHTRLLIQFLTENVQKLLTTDVETLANISQIIDTLKPNNAKLFIDLNCFDIYETNSIIDALIDFDIVLQSRNYLEFRRHLEKSILDYYDCIEYLQYNFTDQVTLNLSVLLKNSSLLKWLLMIYLLIDVRYI